LRIFDEFAQGAMATVTMEREAIFCTQLKSDYGKYVPAKAWVNEQLAVLSAASLYLVLHNFRNTRL
jgi:hypothetical protein